MKNDLIEAIKLGMSPMTKRVSVVENGKKQYYSVTRKGLGPLETKFGEFWEFVFEIDDQWIDYAVIARADINKKTLMPEFKNENKLIVRTDSGCATGQIFGDLTCECLDQLHLAMKTISDAGEGMIIHIPRQDGRGMGVPFKLATLWLQKEFNVNTIEAALMLAKDETIDARTYAGVVAILKFFEIPEACCINLATNNPRKIKIFSENGYAVKSCDPIHAKSNKNIEHHLKAKEKYYQNIK
ncbi:MAG: hypothetical protein WC848_01130 [Parcubacteria group bacterium]